MSEEARPVDSGVGMLKKVGLLFAATIAVYLGVFYFVENNRVKDGPWEVQFTKNAENQPQVIVSHQVYGVQDLTITMVDETAPEDFNPETMTFTEPRPYPFDIPFGRVIFQDLTFQPGTLTMHLMDGYEIELIKRTLIVNKKEHPWGTTSAVEVKAEEKLRYLKGGPSPEDKTKDAY